MDHSELKTAPISAFKSLRAPILCGQNLNDVKALERSILELGLMSPIVVSIAKKHLVIIDGKKRIAAIKRLAFAGNLPRSLVNIPYILTDEANQMDFRTTSILSGRELYTAVTALKQSGLEIEEIAARLYLDRRSIVETLSLSRLSRRIRQAYFSKTISFQQALAYTAIPDETAQEALLLDLGPFAQPRVILETIRENKVLAKARNEIKHRMRPSHHTAETNVFALPRLENSYTDYAHIPSRIAA